MKYACWMLVLASVGACKKVDERAACEHPPCLASDFDRTWTQLEKSGAEPVFVEGELHGGGLLGEVRRAVDPSVEAAIARSPSPLPGPLPDAEVIKVIRRNLTAVKSCYQIEERAGTVASGKAIVTIEIDGSSGAVIRAAVEAPAFLHTQLPACVEGRAKGWQFPKFTSTQPKRFSYPFVFVGG